MRQTDFEEPMSTLCKMVVKTRYEDLPAKVVDYAKDQADHQQSDWIRGDLEVDDVIDQAG